MGFRAIEALRDGVHADARSHLVLDNGPDGDMGLAEEFAPLRGRYLAVADRMGGIQAYGGRAAHEPTLARLQKFKAKLDLLLHIAPGVGRGFGQPSLLARQEPSVDVHARADKIAPLPSVAVVQDIRPLVARRSLREHGGPRRGTRNWNEVLALGFGLVRLVPVVGVTSVSAVRAARRAARRLLGTTIVTITVAVVVSTAATALPFIRIGPPWRLMPLVGRLIRQGDSRNEFHKGINWILGITFVRHRCTGGGGDVHWSGRVPPANDRMVLGSLRGRIVGDRGGTQF